jgi:hypothetical protein
LCQNAKCGSANQSLALFCRRCGHPVTFPQLSAAALDPNSVNRAFSDSKQPVVRYFSQHFECAPVVFCGFVWAISATGDVWRLTPANGQPSVLGSLGSGFGGSPLTLGHFPVHNGTKVPLLLAVSRETIAAWNLAAGEGPSTLARANGNGRFLASLSSDGYVGVACLDDRVFALLESDGAVDLFSCRGSGGDEWRGVAAPPPIAGPLVIDRQVCCYSRDTIYWLNNEGQLTPYAVGRGIRLLPSPKDPPGFLPPGAFPWILGGRGAYLPAQMAGVFGLLFVRFGADGPTSQFVALPRGASYSQAADGRLLVCRRGQLLLFDDGGGAPQHTDPQMSASGVEYYDAPLYVYCAETAGRLMLHVHLRGSGIELDMALPHGQGESTMTRFAAAGDAFVLPFFDQQLDKLDIGVAIWRL